MHNDTDTLTALLREASRQSAPFQSLIHDYSMDVMSDPEAHRLFISQLNNNLPMLRRIGTLKASVGSSTAGPEGISPAMHEVLDAAFALPTTSHTSVAEIVNLVASELAWRRIDQRLDAPLTDAEEYSH